MTQSDETDLVAAASAGNEDAFCALVRLHQAAVRAFVGRWCRSPEAADDIAQEVFIAAFAALPGYEQRSSFRTWLFGFARNKTLTWLRGEGRRRSVSLDASIDAWQAQELERAGEADVELDALRACVDELPAQSARMVREFYAGSGQEELAKRYNRSTGSLRVALCRLRRLLRVCVERRLAGGPADA